MATNIYELRHYRLLVAIPIALMLLGIYFIPSIQLDSSLKGGINLQLQTNATLDVRQLTTLINSKIPGAQASVSAAPAGISVTIATNASIASAETELLGIYSAYGNYSKASVNVTALQGEIAAQPGNATLQGMLASAKTAQQGAHRAVNATLAKELVYLKPFIGGATYNSSNVDAMLNVSKGAYANASAKYESLVVGTFHGILPFSTYSYNEVTPTLGAYFLGQMLDVIIAAFVLVAITVFVIFRSPIPSFTVVFGAVNDIVVALGVMAVLGIPLGISSIGGLLMLIGYSIDTDMLAAIRVLKRTEGTSPERAFSAMKTGMTMTSAAIVSFAVLFAVSYVTFIQTYFEISSVVLAGLVADLAATWLGSMILLLWYKQKKEVRR
jgi:preprotein translocase subunit SecF